MKSRFTDFEDMQGGESHSFSVITDYEETDGPFTVELDKELPILPLRNTVLFPGVILPVVVGRRTSLKLINEAMKKNLVVGAVCQKQNDVEYPTLDDLYTVGTAARVMRLIEMPDQTYTVILQGLQRISVQEVHEVRPQYYLKGTVTPLEDVFPENEDKEFMALLDTCRENALKMMFLEYMPMDPNSGIRNIKNPLFLVNFVCSNFPLKIEDKIRLLLENSIKERVYKLINVLDREIQFSELKHTIHKRTREEIDRQQREYFLQQQMKNIQDELGGSAQDQEINELYEKGSQKKWSDAVADIFRREVEKLERINPQSADYNVQLNYLQTMLNLPWNEYTVDNLNLVNAEKTLNRDHYGLKEVKERILEHLAVIKLNGTLKSPILCLYGPPGVGKTSLGKSIADALKRKYVRISLGGLHDEAEIRGHRKTYVGAMPGRILKGLMKAGSSNPVFVLDEIDKVTQATHNGDPASALLEVLDPEQNNAFHDNFLDVDYDLSHVMFIATANDISKVPDALRDRMELIEVSGYVAEEKVEIARKYLIPRAMENSGIPQYVGLKFPKKTIDAIITSYTSESGVRGLEKKINKIMRKLAFHYATKLYMPMTQVHPSDLEGLLGVQEHSHDAYQGNDSAGVVTGLAWTPHGGEILTIESSLSRGKGSKLTLTGNLGDVMKESAMLALEFIKAHAAWLQINSEVFENWNIHIHAPEGAVPKDGPSAGITMTTALASLLTQRKVKPNLAMTGEITLRGKVLPVGGIKEKLLAAKRAGITDIIMCEENRKNVNDIPEMYLKGVTFHYVTNMKEVLELALTDEKVKDAIDLNIN